VAGASSEPATAALLAAVRSLGARLKRPAPRAPRLFARTWRPRPLVLRLLAERSAAGGAATRLGFRIAGEPVIGRAAERLRRPVP
jgi:hypothetical protein